MINPLIVPSDRPPLADQAVEIVERKGLGHPDTICDAVMERSAVELAQAYLKTCGRVLHFNADKGMLIAGQVECRPGGGRVLTPMRLVIDDRATLQCRRRRVPEEDIAEQTAYQWFKRHLPHMDPPKHLTRSSSNRLRPNCSLSQSAAVERWPTTPRRLGVCSADSHRTFGFPGGTVPEQPVF